MSYLDRLVNASFRGVTFLTESHETKLGRRLVVHEFPGADLPLIEDLGAKASEVHLNAYFIGPDYDIARDKFLLLLQKTGADWLIHPWLGRIEVRAKEWSIGESNDKNGFCTIGIDFVPAGAVITQAKIDAVDNAADKSARLADSAQGLFDLSVMSSDALNSFIATASSRLDRLRTILAVATIPLTWSQQIARQVQSVKDDFNELLALPDDYKAALRSVYDLVSGVDADPDATVSTPVLSEPLRVRLVGMLIKQSTIVPINAALLTIPVSPTSPLELPANIAKDAILHACFLISASAQLALADYATAETRDAVLVSLLDAIDTLLPKLPDIVFEAAVSARVAIIEALMAQNFGTIDTRTVFEPMPATVLAHRLEDDEAVFIATNYIRHPLFVSGVVHG